MFRVLVLGIIIFCISIQLNAQNPRQLTVDAVELYKSGNTNAAIKKLNEAIDFDPSFADARLMLGQIYLETNLPRQAEKIIKPALILLKDNPGAHFALGVAYFEQQKFKSALKEIKKVLALNSTYERAAELLSLCYLNLGVADYQKGLKNNGVEKFKKSIKANSANIQAYRNLAAVLYETGEREEIKNIVKKGLKVSPKEKTLLKILIQTLVETNNLEEALKPAKKYFKYYPNDIDGGLQLAYLYRYNNEGDKAFDIYEKLIKEFPAEQKIHDEYAELYRLRRKYDKAVAVYEKLLLHSSDKSIVYEKIAEIYVKAKRYDDARASYRKALENITDGSNIFQKIAKTYLDENKNNSAVKTYLEALKVNPKHWELLRELGKVFEDFNPDSAVSVYKEMIKIKPGSPYPNIRLAAIFHNKGFTERAFENCQQSINLGTVMPLPYHIIAELYLNKKDTTNSIINEKLSVGKALTIISKSKKIFMDELSRSGGKLNLNQMEEMEDDAKAMELSQDILSESLQNLLHVENPFLFESDLKEWMKEYSEEPLLFEYLSKTYEKQQENNKALSIYKQLIKLKPKNIEGHLGFARVMEKQGEYKNAILAYKRALTIDSEDPEIYHRLISLCKHENSIEQLIEEWLLRAKRESQNKVLLTNLKAILNSTGKEKEFAQVEEMLIKSDKHEDD